MRKTNSSDKLFRDPLGHVVDFMFDEQVADVFPDMIRRSVPGYDSIISMLGVFAQHYVVPGSRVYDLGCSLGAATLSMRRRIQQPDVSMFAIDNAEAMAQRCRELLARESTAVPTEVVCADVREVQFENVSLVVLNFTLQFIDTGERLDILRRIADGMLPGGALIVSEKVTFDDRSERDRNEALHREFKRANGYSELEISQKRAALENVLVPDTIATHRQRLAQAGLINVDMWFRCFNFVSFVAHKP